MVFLRICNHIHISMMHPPREDFVELTLKNALETFHNYLGHQSLAAKCLAPLSSISAKLGKCETPQQLQSLLRSLLETDFFLYCCKSWTSEGFPSNARDKISRLLYEVSSSIAEGQGELSAGLILRGSHACQLVVAFYFNIYSQALNAKFTSQLSRPENRGVSDDVVTIMNHQKEFVHAFYLNHQLFTPYLYFVQKAELFYTHIARCIGAGEEVAELGCEIDKNMSTLTTALTWGSVKGKNNAAHHWKILFIVDLCNSYPSSERSLMLLTHLVDLIDLWSTFLEIALHLLSMISTTSEIDRAIGRCIDTRMALKSVTAHRIKKEKDLLAMWDFLNKILECDSFELNAELWYDENGSIVESGVYETLKKYQTLVHLLMGDSRWFVDSFTNSLPYLYQLARKCHSSTLQFNSTKSLSAFMIFGICNFFNNSLIINKSICYSLFQMLSQDCTMSTALPEGILAALVSAMVPVNKTQYQELSNICQSGASDNKSSGNTQCNVLRNVEGTKQAIFLFETINGYVYASVRAKQMAQNDRESRGSELETHSRGRLQ